MLDPNERQSKWKLAIGGSTTIQHPCTLKNLQPSLSKISKNLSKINPYLLSNLFSKNNNIKSKKDTKTKSTQAKNLPPPPVLWPPHQIPNFQNNK